VTSCCCCARIVDRKKASRCRRGHSFCQPCLMVMAASVLESGGYIIKCNAVDCDSDFTAAALRSALTDQQMKTLATRAADVRTFFPQIFKRLFRANPFVLRFYL